MPLKQQLQKLPGFLPRVKLSDRICLVNLKLIIVLFSLIFLIASTITDALPRELQTEVQILKRSQKLSQGHNYVAALQTLDLGLAMYPDSQILGVEFRKNSELYIVHEISKGYQRIDQNPYDVQAYIRVSDAFWLAGQRFKALEVLTDGVSKNQKASPLWVAIGNLEQMSGRPKEARSAFREAKRYESVK